LAGYFAIAPTSCFVRKDAQENHHEPN